MLQKKTRRHHVTYPHICNIHLRAQGNRRLYGALIGGGSDILQMNDANPQHTTHSRTAVQNMHHQPSLQHFVTTDLRLWEALTAFDSLSLSLPRSFSLPRCRPHRLLQIRPGPAPSTQKKTSRHLVTYAICKIQDLRESMPLRRSHPWRQRHPPDERYQSTTTKTFSNGGPEHASPTESTAFRHNGLEVVGSTHSV